MVAKYPVEPSDQEGIVDAVNYLLSGPAGLGQNFDGFSSFQPTYVRPSNRQPWSLPITTGLNPSIFLEIPINDIQPVGSNPSQFLTVTFTTPQTTPPFQFGDRVDIQNVVETGSDTDLNQFNDVVFSCTTTEVVVGYNGDFDEQTWNTYVSGGTIGRDYMNVELETDCNAQVSVQGPTDRVFINGQITIDYGQYAYPGPPYPQFGDAGNLYFRIYRYRGFPSETPGSSEYLFADEVLIAEYSEPIYSLDVFNPVTTLGLPAYFISVLDGPNLEFGYYQYILQVYFNVEGSLFVDTETFTLSGTKAASASTILYSGITPTTVTGNGSGAVIDVELAATASDVPYLSNAAGDFSGTYNTIITVTTTGPRYKPGDILTVPGTSLGGASPDNDLTLTVQYVGPPYAAPIERLSTKLRSLTAQVVKE